jgi:hypothetical protein
MFVIIDPQTGCYFAKDHQKIILFETKIEAINFAQSFIRYAQMKKAQEDPLGALQFAFYSPNIIPWDEKSVGAETILFSELKP